MTIFFFFKKKKSQQPLTYGDVCYIFFSQSCVNEGLAAYLIV